MYAYQRYASETLIISYVGLEETVTKVATILRNSSSVSEKHQEIFTS